MTVTGSFGSARFENAPKREQALEPWTISKRALPPVLFNWSRTDVAVAVWAARTGEVGAIRAHAAGRDRRNARSRLKHRANGV